MIEKLLTLSLEELENGYAYHPETDCYICHICGRSFENGEIFKVGDHYYDAAKRVRIHMKEEHPNMLDILASNDKKYTGITENQKDLLMMIFLGMTDSEMAKKTGTAPATIRHQRFIFREKAKQAKLFLSIYELAMRGADHSKHSKCEKDEIIDSHRGATMLDDRYFTTKAEEEKILSTLFSSLSPLKLETFSSKEKKKIVILKKISEQFERGKKYSEKELNTIIKEIYGDFATIRRYLIEYGFMERTNDCKEYWLK